MRWFNYLILLSHFILNYAKIDMNRNGCGDTKACLFKPAGCNPQLDCTIGLFLTSFLLSKIFLICFQFLINCKCKIKELKKLPKIQSFINFRHFNFLGIIFYVSEPNRLTVQMVAQSLLPTPNFQYIALGFSKDPLMVNNFMEFN